MFLEHHQNNDKNVLIKTQHKTGVTVIPIKHANSDAQNPISLMSVISYQNVYLCVCVSVSASFYIPCNLLQKFCIWNFD